MDEILLVVFKTTSVYIFIVVGLRLFGKKELSQLSVFDLVFILLISNAVQNAMVGSDISLQGGLVAASTLFVVNLIFKNLLFNSKNFSRIVQGEPVMLIHNGNVIEENLVKEKISFEELDAAVREHGVESIKAVNLAVMEIDGNISVLSNNYQHKTSRKRRAHKAITKNE